MQLNDRIRQDEGYRNMEHPLYNERSWQDDERYWDEEDRQEDDYRQNDQYDNRNGPRYDNRRPMNNNGGQAKPRDFGGNRQPRNPRP